MSHFPFYLVEPKSTKAVKTHILTTVVLFECSKRLRYLNDAYCFGAVGLRRAHLLKGVRPARSYSAESAP